MDSISLSPSAPFNPLVSARPAAQPNVPLTQPSSSSMAGDVRGTSAGTSMIASLADQEDPLAFLQSLPDPPRKTASITATPSFLQAQKIVQDFDNEAQQEVDAFFKKDSILSRQDLEHRKNLAETLTHDPQIMEGVRNWDKLSTDQRMAIAQRAGELAAKEFGFSPAEMRFDPNEKGGGYTPVSEQGDKDWKQGEITLGPKALKNPEMALNAAVHEQIHAMQDARAQVPLSNQQQKWAHNNAGLNYMSAADDHTKNKVFYKAQPLEAHAYSIGNYIGRKVKEAK